MRHSSNVETARDESHVCWGGTVGAEKGRESEREGEIGRKREMQIA